MSDETPTPDEQPLSGPPADEAAAGGDLLGAGAGAGAGDDPGPEATAGEAAPPPAPSADAADAVEADAVEDDADDGDATPRVRPAIPGMDLEVDIVAEGTDPLARLEAEAEQEHGAAEAAEDAEEDADQPIAAATIDLAAGARYRATGKRKTSVARVILRPGTGAYTVNGKTLDEFFPRPTLQRTIRQPLEAVGYEDRMDVVARMHGGGVSAQAGALRHGISRALLEADPNLRGELKRRGFLTRDARAKERKKAGLKKARKRPQFSKR